MAQTFTDTSSPSSPSPSSTLLASGVLSRVETQLNDAGNVQWPEPTLLEYLSDAQMQLYEYRPDLFLSSAQVMQTPVDITAATDELKVDKKSRLILVNLVCSFAFAESDDRQNLERSNAYKNDALALMFGKGR